MAVLDSRVQDDDGYRISGTPRGKRVSRWPDRIDQQYLARIIEEGRLTGRDTGLMSWLSDVRCATAEQISRVFFSSKGTGRNRLTQLYRMRILERAFFPPDDANELGISPYSLVYYVGRGGRYWLGQVEKRRFESGWKVLLPQQVAHDLMSTELIAALHEDFRRFDKATRTRVQMRLESEVVFWKLDGTGKPELRAVKRKGETVKERVPLLRSDMRLEAKLSEDDDAASLLSVFIEADRGTMNQTQFGEKVQAYNQAAEQWRNRETVREAKGEGAARPFPMVLVVTTGAARARNLTKTISEKAAEGVVWAVLDWAGLRGLAGGGALTATVWHKATRSKLAAEKALLPGLAARLSGTV